MKSLSLITSLRIAVIVLFMAVSPGALATLIPLEATIDGAQANAGAGTGSAGTGSATMTYDDLTGLFAWEIEWSGLSGPAVIAHFHGPALPGSNAGVEVNIPVLTSPSIGSEVISNSQAADLLAGRWYINIHTQQNIGGEIRGQVVRSAVVPLPSSLGLLVVALLGLGLRRRLPV
jgi:hypothetical protein